MSHVLLPACSKTTRHAVQSTPWLQAAGRLTPCHQGHPQSGPSPAAPLRGPLPARALCPAATSSGPQGALPPPAANTLLMNKCSCCTEHALALHSGIACWRAACGHTQEVKTRCSEPQPNASALRHNLLAALWTAGAQAQAQVTAGCSCNAPGTAPERPPARRRASPLRRATWPAARAGAP